MSFDLAELAVEGKLGIHMDSHGKRLISIILTLLTSLSNSFINVSGGYNQQGQNRIKENGTIIKGYYEKKREETTSFMKRNWNQVEHVIYLSGCNDLEHLLPAWMKVSTRGSEKYSKLSQQEKCSLTLKHSNDYFTNATVKKLHEHCDIIRDYLKTVQTFIADSIP